MVFPGRAIASRRTAAFSLSPASTARAAIPRAAPRLVARVVASQADRRGGPPAESVSEWRSEFEERREARRSEYRNRWSTALQAKHEEAAEKRKSVQDAARRAASRPTEATAPALQPPPARRTSSAAPSASAAPAAPAPSPNHVEAHIVRSEGLTSASGVCTVTFNLKFHAEYGQSLKVIGSCSSLGSWNLSQAPTMLWGPNDVWSVVINVDQSSVLEYKYVLLDRYGQPMAWQQGNNGVLAVKSAQEELAVHDNWEGGPGASVLSKDGSVTRENQLLSWANDIEAMMSNTKNQLRQSSMELTAAKEEIRAARMENAHLRTELQVERAMAKRREEEIRELKEANLQLSMQLAESNSGFKRALETASVLLSELDEMSTGLITMPPDVTAKVQGDAVDKNSESAPTAPSTDAVPHHGGSRGYAVAASAVTATHLIALESSSEEYAAEVSARQQ